MSESVTGFAIKKENAEINRCKICPMGKQTRSPFPKSKTQSKKILELIHSDLCGPMENKSLGGAKYMLTLTDDFSRKTFLYFLKEKSQVTKTFKLFKNAIENETDHRIKKLRTDNGTEYVNNELLNFCEESGILQQFTCTYTPEQNGVAERANRTIVERAKCMLYDAGLETRFWAEACNMAAHLMNRTVRSALNFKTPEELWNGEKPDISHLKIFGTKVMVHTPKQKRTKWAPKSMEMIFLGFDHQTKGYRCYDPNKRQVIISRDVKFFESPSSTVTVDVLGGDEERKNDEVNESTASIETAESNESTDTVVDATILNTQQEIDNTNDSQSESEDDREVDSTFTTRAKIDGESTPKKSNRERRQFMPFQITHFALLSTEPQTVREATNDKAAIEWKAAMQEEIRSHNENQTWTLCKLPAKRKTIRSKWIFKLKTNDKNEPLRYKARLVAMGCGQKYGIDYEETFSPVVRHNTIRFLMALAVERNMKVYQMDAITAFLQGDLEEEIYMTQPEGFEDGSDRVCRLHRAIYGLKQAGRQWNKKLDQFLIEIGFERDKCDPCVYLKINLIIAIYVDDLLIFFTDRSLLDELKARLHQKFKMKDIGLAENCLGINIKQVNDFIELSQQKYVIAILQKFGMLNAKPAVSPSDTSKKLSKSMVNENNSITGLVPYQEAVGCLLYLANATRPDISFATSDVSRFNNDHAETHWIAVKRIMRYLNGTMDLCLRYTKTNGPCLKAYVDADWASEIDDRKSRTGYIVKMAGAAISWSSKKQPIIALSSTEAEYIALSAVVREVLWLRQLHDNVEKTTNKKQCTEVFCDNQSAIQLATMEAYRSRTKHIDIRHHHVRHEVQQKNIELIHLSTEMQIADSLTKAVTGDKTAYCAKGMGLMH